MDSITRLVRPEVRALKAYHVPDSKGFVKLDAMENPYEWPDSMVSEWLEVLRGASPNRYPDPACDELKAALKAANDVPSGCDLLLGNGSDEIIQILLMALNPGSTVMAPEPTFVMYRQIAHSLGLNFVGIPLNPVDFSIELAVFTEAVVENDPALIFLAYPNNPTANLFDRQAIEAILKISRDEDINNYKLEFDFGQSNDDDESAEKADGDRDPAVEYRVIFLRPDSTIQFGAFHQSAPPLRPALPVKIAPGQSDRPFLPEQYVPDAANGRH